MRSCHLIVALVAGALTCCGNRGTPEAASVNNTVATRSEEMPTDTSPSRIYHDLMRYGWYQRAEPLVFGQQSYVPSGAPVTIPLAKLRLAGNYQGVDFYILQTEREPPATVYVPVYEGYWLSFVAAPTTGA